jgi:hypothetical protein
MESLSGLCFCARAIHTWACTVLETSRMRECILNSGVIAFECICRRIRATGSICYSYIKIGVESLISSDCSSDLTLMYQGSNTDPTNPFQRVFSMTALISLSGAMNMTAASFPSRLQASDTLSRSQVHPLQLPSLKARRWISMGESFLAYPFAMLMVLFKTCRTSQDPRDRI